MTEPRFVHLLIALATLSLADLPGFAHADRPESIAAAQADRNADHRRRELRPPSLRIVQHRRPATRPPPAPPASRSRRTRW